jgi:hypothetical protein
VLVALATAAVFAVPFRLRYVPSVNRHHALDPPVSYRRDISSLQVQTNRGAVVTIVAGRPGQVTVSSSASWTVGKPVLTEAWRDGNFRFAATCPKLDPFGDCSASVVIEVPAGTAVHAQAGAGSVTVTGMTGPLHMSATSGLLTVRNVSGPVWASVTSGSLIGPSVLTSQRFVASATTGQIMLDFGVPPQSMAVSVGDGSAVITLPTGSRYRIASSPGPGALDIAPGLSDPRSGLVLAATIGAGAVSIGYPPGPR